MSNFVTCRNEISNFVTSQGPRDLHATSCARARGKLLCAALRQLLCAALSEDLESASEKPWLKVAVMQVSDLANLVRSIIALLAIFVSVMQRYVNQARASRRNALSLRKRPLQQSSAQLRGQKRAAAAAATTMPMEMQIQVCSSIIRRCTHLACSCECS